MDDNCQSISKNVGLFPQKRADQQSRGELQGGKIRVRCLDKHKIRGKIRYPPSLRSVHSTHNILSLKLDVGRQPRRAASSPRRCSVNLSIHSVFAAAGQAFTLTVSLSSREIFPKNRQLMEAICPCFRRKWMTINFQNW